MHFQQIMNIFHDQVLTWPTWITGKAKFLYFGTFQAQENLNNVQNCSISPEDAKFKLCIFSNKQTHSMPKSQPGGPELLMRPYLYFETFQVQKNYQQFSKLLHNSWRCKIQIMHIQQLGSKHILPTLIIYQIDSVDGSKKFRRL